ncbi:PREDICTED: acyl-CoA synthetase family member 2, mitochondrial-like, partial [Priapulus caudatus]|uniref:Medium-chain acyl-CoA ligase ACSF2, mitochondrial n=1 Tax=Priapulus caudatus TaxID=37621 RepID=A0ABM1E4D1_PRICU
ILHIENESIDSKGAVKVVQYFIVMFHSSSNGKLVQSYLQVQAEEPLLGCTIGMQLEEAALKYPDREAFVLCKDNVRYTYEQVLEKSDELAAGLHAIGVKVGDRVGIWGPNTAEWLLAQYGCARGGFVLVNINPAYQVDELEYCLQKVGVKAILAEESFKTQNYYSMIHSISPELESCKPGQLKSKRLPMLRSVVMYNAKNQHPGTFQWSDLVDVSSNKGLQYVKDLQKKLQFDDAANIQFTSGTTGTPKGATLSHHNVVNNAYFLGLRLGYDKEVTRVCMPVPLYHCFGCVVGSLCSVIHGGTLVCPSPSFQPDATLKAVQQESCSSLYGTPTMFIDMLNHENFPKYDMSTLRTGVMAGSPCPTEIMKQVVTKMHMPDVTICYGTTETSPVTFQSYMNDPLEKRVSSIGHPASHVEVKVVDSENRLVPINTPGELCTRGYTTMLGYWGDEEKTRECILPDRWYKTGDLAVLDEDGFGRIIGRIKDMLIRGGENIYPTEIEQFLYKHEAVEDVQVIGVPDKRMGEELCAWIRLKKGHEHTTAEELRHFCKGKIAHFKIPRYMLFVDEYPLTVTGKVQKYKIREASRKILNLGEVHLHAADYYHGEMDDADMQRK